MGTSTVSYFKLLAGTREKNLLFSALVELTYRCNLDCFFCYNDLELEGRALTLEQYGELFSDLRDLGAFYLVLSGGEPLCHPEFFAIGRKARELGFAIRLKSNGHALRGALARRVRDEVDPFVIEISLHGATAAVHDRQTRIAGSFERLMRNLPELKGLGLRLQLNTALTRWNEGEMDRMVELAGRLEIPLQIDPEVTPRDDGDLEPLEIRASREALLRLFRLQSERRDTSAVRVVKEADALAPERDPDGESAKHCGAGASTVAVDPYGNVYPCVQWRQAVGNLHQQSMREIWDDRSRKLEEIRRLNREARRLVATTGEAGKLISFCPGSAWRDVGSAATLYPEAERRLRLQGEVLAERSTRRSLPILR